MCIVKTPKIQTDPAADAKPVPVLRNPFLDGVGSSMNSLRIGRNQLRIDRTPSQVAADAASQSAGTSGVRIPTTPSGMAS